MTNTQTCFTVRFRTAEHLVDLRVYQLLVQATARRAEFCWKTTRGGTRLRRRLKR